MEAEYIPDSIAKLRGMTDYEEEIGFHPTGPTPTTGGVPTAKYHAGGEAPQDVRENQLKEWLREVANGAARQLGGDTAPLVVAADERNLGHFRACCSYPHLLSDGIAEHPQALDEGDLHRRAWTLVEPVFAERVKEAQDRFASLAGEGHERAPHDVPSIIRAARDGRVEVLFVAEDAQLFGTVDPETGMGEIRRDGKGEDLLDRATAEALATGACVYALPREQVPGRHAAAAILRY